MKPKKNISLIPEKQNMSVFRERHNNRMNSKSMSNALKEGKKTHKDLEKEGLTIKKPGFFRRFLNRITRRQRT
jgi:hypothetical protein